MKNRNFTQEELTTMKQLYTEEFRTLSEIADIFGTSHVTISVRLRKMGVKIRRKWAKKTRLCRRCNEELPISAFYKKDYICKECRPKFQKENMYHLRKFGISKEEYVEILGTQNEVCAICGGDNNGRPLYVDHDHNTGEVRGLLCGKCNSGLGLFNDSIELLNKASAYLSGVP